MTSTNNFCIGLDLGQSADYTALAIIERVVENGRTQPLHLRHLQRYPLKTPYTDIADSVAALVKDEKLTTTVTDYMLSEVKLPPRLVIDRTGVGAAVADTLSERGLRFDSVVIHGGDRVSREGGIWRVPKRDLVDALVVSLQGGHLRAAKGLELWPTLRAEALNFKRKIDLRTAHDSYEHWRESDHDDLVLAVCLACWGAVRGRGAQFFSF